MNFFRHLSNVIQFMQLPKDKRKLVFYSEGKNYWPHLEGIIEAVLKKNNIHLCYITSDENDPGLEINHEYYRSFTVDQSYIRNWLFENIETDIMVMTMPDLDNFQIKRSKHKVHYVYVQHSLVSLHMIYRKNAFDHYDTIFCAGPHHVREIRAMEAVYNLTPKSILEHGYHRLDTILKEKCLRTHKTKNSDSPTHVLIAPSWGPNGTIESGKAKIIIGQLLDQGFEVTLRPHPQTIKFAKNQVTSILDLYNKNSMFHYENNIAGQNSLHDSDIMISDWSGAALDYAYGLNKPVFFADVPRKVNNPDYEDINIEPFEVSCIPKIGKKLSDGDKFYDFTIPDNLNTDLTGVVFNPHRSAEIGANYLTNLIKKINL